MKHAFCAISLSFLCLPSFGCSGDSASDDDGGSGTGGASTGGSNTGGASGSTSGTGGSGTGGGTACGADITANPVNNYAFSSTLSFPPIMVQPDTELTFNWSAVTRDFLDHDLDPMGDIQTVNVMLWTLTQEALQTKLNADQLLQRELAVVATLPTERMTTTASLFTFLTGAGMPVTSDMILPFLSATGYPPETHTYTVMISDADELGEGTRMIQAFKLDPASTITEVTLTSESTHLEYSVNMHELTRTPVPAGNPAITIDWRSMTTTSLGTEFLPNDITEALVAHYTESVTELEAQFLDLELIADQMWRGTIDAGTTATLSSFTNVAAGGAPFAGIDGNGTWILALVCGACRNPAPWYLTVLTTCTP